MLALIALLALGATSRAVPQEQPLQVVTTLEVLRFLAAEIGGERVEARALASPLQDPHFVQPRPTLMKKARDADLFIEVGLQLELWAAKVVDGTGNPRILSGRPGRVIASLGVPTLEIPQVVSREWGDVHPYGNPHVWLDPVRAVQMAENIARALGTVDPVHRDGYQARFENWRDETLRRLCGAALFEQLGPAKLLRLARQDLLPAYLERRGLQDQLGGWLQQAAPLHGRPVVTYHKSWIYLGRRFGFEIPIEIEEHPGIPPSARHRDRVIELMRERQIRTVLMASYYPLEAAEYVAEETGASVVSVPLDLDPGEGLSTYADLIDLLLGRLLEAEARP